MLWASIDTSELDAVGVVIAERVEVPFVSAATGLTNLIATLVCHDTGALHPYLTTRFASLPVSADGPPAPSSARHPQNPTQRPWRLRARTAVSAAPVSFTASRRQNPLKKRGRVRYRACLRRSTWIATSGMSPTGPPRVASKTGTSADQA